MLIWAINWKGKNIEIHIALFFFFYIGFFFKILGRILTKQCLQQGIDNTLVAIKEQKCTETDSLLFLADNKCQVLKTKTVTEKVSYRWWRKQEPISLQPFSFCFFLVFNLGNNHFGYIYMKRYRKPRLFSWGVFNPVEKLQNKLNIGTAITLLLGGFCSCWGRLEHCPSLHNAACPCLPGFCSKARIDP